MDYTLTLKKFAAGSVLALAAASVSALPMGMKTFDFVSLVDGPGIPGGDTFETSMDGLTYTSTATPTGEQGYKAMRWTTADGLELTVNGGSDFAYLDGKTGKGPAGLGVCGKLDSGGECDPSSDDNVTKGETLNLSFNYGVRIFDYTLRDANHSVINSVPSSIEVKVDAGSWMQLNSFSSLNPLVGMNFSFRTTSDASKTDQFYISNVVASVPEPATLALLGMGLAGFGLSRRRKQA